MNKHTPGPWWVEEWPSGGSCPPDVHFLSVFGKTTDTGLDFIISDMRGAPDGYYANAGEGEANARLIAAAPDLLAACERALDEMDGRPRGPGAVQQLRAAIAKAQGGVS